jgi:hypothetical protein
MSPDCGELESCTTFWTRISLIEFLYFLERSFQRRKSLPDLFEVVCDFHFPFLL